MGDDYKTVTVENLTNLSEEDWKEFSKMVTEEYYRRLKVKLLAWWDKAKVGGTRVKDIALTAAGLAVFIWAIKEILK